MTTTYENAPLHEVVISASVPPLLELMHQHVGLLWSELRSAYPKCEQHPTIGIPIEAPGEFFPLPRFWFVSADDTEVLQIQRDRFIANWRRREDLVYPRFDAVKTLFATYYEKLRAFTADQLEVEFPDTTALEVTYINVLDPALGWNGIGSLKDILPEFSPPQLGSDVHLKAFNIVLTAKETDSDDTLTVSLKNGSSSSTGEPGLILEIKVVSKDTPRTPEQSLDWIQQAHDCVISTFNALTSEDVQKNVWLRVDPANA